MDDIKVISLGGSIIVPGEVDSEFLVEFYQLIHNHLQADISRKFILVCGGGAVARQYQIAFSEVCRQSQSGVVPAYSQDWIGIAATRLNGELLKHIFAQYCEDEVVIDPTSDFLFSGRILIAAGWKPGFSTDYDAVVLAERFRADTVINLSNIAKVYTDDPKENPAAVPIDEINWADFRRIVGDEWVPGKNAPFDPVASKQAAITKLKVIMAWGKDLDNLSRILNHKDFTGTVIGPD